jgi:hypothetical protein
MITIFILISYYAQPTFAASCAAGKYSIASSTACSVCLAGTYASSANSTSCTICPAGYYSSAGAASCNSCPAGTYSSNILPSESTSTWADAWSLVRRVKSGYTWHPSTDHLVGTDVYGTFVDDSTSDSTFSKSFSDSSFSYFLFITGDKTVRHIFDIFFNESDIQVYVSFLHRNGSYLKKQWLLLVVVTHFVS